MKGLEKISRCLSLPRMMAQRATWPCPDLSHGTCTGGATPRGATAAAAQALSLAPSPAPALILQGLMGPRLSSADPAVVKGADRTGQGAFTSHHNATMPPWDSQREKTNRRGNSNSLVSKRIQFPQMKRMMK